jgi:virginiamycin B lyase
MHALPRIAACSALALLLAACGGGANSGGSPVIPLTTTLSAASHTLSASPAQLQFTGTGASHDQTFTASQTGGGALYASTSDANVATVNPGSQNVSGSGNTKSATFTVTPMGAGSCSITVTDKHGLTSTVGVTVTLSTPPPPPAPSVVAHYAIAPSNESFGITNASDGSVWYTQWYSDAVGRMTTAGANTNYAFTGTPDGLALGPDGNFWVVDHANDRIAVMSSGGTAGASYALSYAPMQIAKGPDNNLWFTAEDGSFSTGFSEIVRITTSGAMQAFPTSTAAQSANRYAYDIVSGPDGRMWFTEGNYIGAITTTGTMTEYPIPSGRTSNFITAGPDGNLWFTENYGNAIGKITPAGSVSEYTLPTLFADPWMIVGGKDGALWFTESGGTGNIGRISTSGSITEYPIANLSGNPALLAGADGNLWVASASSEMLVLSY